MQPCIRCRAYWHDTPYRYVPDLWPVHILRSTHADADVRGESCLWKEHAAGMDGEGSLSEWGEVGFVSTPPGRTDEVPTVLPEGMYIPAAGELYTSHAAFTARCVHRAHSASTRMQRTASKPLCRAVQRPACMYRTHQSTHNLTCSPSTPSTPFNPALQSRTSAPYSQPKRHTHINPTPCFPTINCIRRAWPRAPPRESCARAAHLVARRARRRAGFDPSRAPEGPYPVKVSILGA